MRKRYNLLPLINENEEVKIRDKRIVPDYLDKELKLMLKKTEDIAQRLEKYAIYLDELQLKIDKRWKEHGVSLNDTIKLYQSFSIAHERIDALDKYVDNLNRFKEVSEQINWMEKD